MLSMIWLIHFLPSSGFNATKLLFMLLLLSQSKSSVAESVPFPRFVGPVSNVTVPLGREVAITCTVENLGSYKVAFVRVDTQTILTIHTHVITRSNRISLSHTDSWTWNLIIKSVKEADRGWYMCQINTDPMMSQNGYLQVVVPPDILDYPTSPDMVVREGANVTLQCAATGFPTPKIIWKREDKQKIIIEDKSVDFREGPFINFIKVNRLHMGIYLCIASNSVPPTVSRRISLIVQFQPMITIAHQLVGAALGQDIVLECHSEAFPKSINYWKREIGQTTVHISKDSTLEGDKYIEKTLDNVYKVTMRLTIRNVSKEDYGSYSCLSKNSLGDTDGLIKLYPITLSPSTLAAKTTTLPSSKSILNQNLSERNGNRRMQSSSGNRLITRNTTRLINGKWEFHGSSVQSNGEDSSEILSHEDESSSSIQFRSFCLFNYLVVFEFMIVFYKLYLISH